MSKAFTREADEDLAPVVPERPVSEHPNLVTAEGLSALKAEIGRLALEQADALRRGDRENAARHGRDLRYMTIRRGSARVQQRPPDADTVRFGCYVDLLYADGRRRSWRIVGEDEADPARGTISYVSPLARALLGKSVGDEVRAGAVAAEIKAIRI